MGNYYYQLRRNFRPTFRVLPAAKDNVEAAAALKLNECVVRSSVEFAATERLIGVGARLVMIGLPVPARVTTGEFVFR